MKKAALLLPLLAIFLCAAPAHAGSMPKVAEDSDGSVVFAAYPPRAAHAPSAHAKPQAKAGKQARTAKQVKVGKPVKTARQASVARHGQTAKATAHQPAAKSPRHASRSPKAAQQKTLRVHAAVSLPGTAAA